MGDTFHGEIWVRANSKEDAVDFVEKSVAAKGLDLIDHRTYDVSNPPGTGGGYAGSDSPGGSGTKWIGSGKSAYRMSITTRKGRDKQRSANL
jgi:hypothetical protein